MFSWSYRVPFKRHTLGLPQSPVVIPNSSMKMTFDQSVKVQERTRFACSILATLWRLSSLSFTAALQDLMPWKEGKSLKCKIKPKKLIPFSFKRLYIVRSETLRFRAIIRSSSLISWRDDHRFSFVTSTISKSSSTVVFRGRPTFSFVKKGISLSSL
jgi:hypothetical protein